MRKKNRLLILSENSSHYAQLIEKHDFSGLEFIACHRARDAKNHAGSCNIILGEPDRIAPVLDAAENLQWIQSTYAGIEVLLSPYQRTDYLLTGVKDLFGPLMSEYVFAYILAFERNIFQTYENQRTRFWQDMPYKSLKGTLLGICGLGSIGRHIALTGKHFGMDIWGYKLSYEELSGVDRLFTQPNFREFLANPDYIVITLPHTPESFHLFDYASFQTMKRSAVLINVGRGPVVSESALVQALEEKLIRGAVLDVFEEEPLPKDSNLWGLPNVFITPHNSAYSFPEDIVDIFAENYRLFVTGEPLKYVVNFDRGY